FTDIRLRPGELEYQAITRILKLTSLLSAAAQLANPALRSARGRSAGHRLQGRRGCGKAEPCLARWRSPRCYARSPSCWLQLGSQAATLSPFSFSAIKVLRSGSAT
ncbi:unnamed protein product, partial [Gulo gulo]